MSSQELPVDIPYAKSLEWLVQRRYVPATHQKILRTIHTKMDDALSEDLPEAARALLPVACSEGITYFDCCKVVEALSNAGLSGKNFLGQFSDPHMARWADIVRRFEVMPPGLELAT